MSDAPRIWVNKRWVPTTQTYEIEEERFATPAQINAIQDVDAVIVEHSILSKHGDESIRDWALVSFDNRAWWVMPETGKFEPAEPPHFCYGNPTKAHCVAHGYCRRNPACNN